MTLEIISIILNGLLGSGFLITMLKLKTERKKAATEIKSGEIDLVSKSVTSMVASQQELMKHNQELIVALTSSRRENSELSEKLDSLEKKIGSILSSNRQIARVLKKLKIDDNVISKIETDA